MLIVENTTDDNSETVVDVSVDISVLSVAISRDNSLDVYPLRSETSVLIVLNVNEDKSDNSVLIPLFADCI